MPLELKFIGVYDICNLNFLILYIFLSLIYVFFFFQIFRDTYSVALPIEGEGQPCFLFVFCRGESWEEEERDKYLSSWEYKNSIEFLLAMRILIFYNQTKWIKICCIPFSYLFKKMLGGNRSWVAHATHIPEIEVYSGRFNSTVGSFISFLSPLLNVSNRNPAIS